MRTFNNPILPGFYPDPSICRIEDDYYLVTSTFTYFPGVPIFHSKDLVHWEQIGNVLTRESQVPLSEGGHSMGIFAPTIRYHKGVFYMITTNVCNGGNFIVTATDPSGPWSDPYWLGSGGIDPSLFFDEDGKCYYCGTKDRREGPAYTGDNEIYCQELDLNTMKLVGESWAIWHSALINAKYSEGPHIYKRNGYYYMMISEGGTGHEHAITVARAKNIRDYFEGYDCNPILTHRHLGLSYPIVNVGHADIVETQNGEWWMVALASRPYGGYYRNLGRETFMTTLTWERDWPVINPGVGKILEVEEAPDLEEYIFEDNKKNTFDVDKLGYEYLYLRNPNQDNYSLEDRPGYLRLYHSKEQLWETKSSTCILKRQQWKSYEIEVDIEV